MWSRVGSTPISFRQLSLFDPKWQHHRRYDLVLKVRDLIHLLESEGWQLKRTRGSHRQFKHPQKGLVVTVPGQLGKDVPVGTLKAILRSAELEESQEH